MFIECSRDFEHVEQSSLEGSSSLSNSISASLSLSPVITFDWWWWEEGEAAGQDPKSDHMLRDGGLHYL